MLTIQQAFDLAMQHHQAGRLAEAENLYRQILAQTPGHADVTHLLGLLALQVGRADAAIELIQSAIQLGLNNPEVYSNLGNALRTIGQLDKAIVAFHKALSLNPNLPGVYVNLGIALKDKGMIDQAIAAYRQAINLNPNIAEAHCSLGSALAETHQLDQAIASYDRAIALQPGYAEAYVNLGNAFKSQGRLNEAISSYKHALTLNPNLFEALANLGNVLSDNGELIAAIEVDRKAIALRPGHAALHSNLGKALQDSGSIDQAIAAYQQATDLDPNFPDAWNNLGTALLETGQADQALAAYERAVALKPAYAEAHRNIGTFHRNSGRLDQAIAAFDKAITADPNYANAHWDRAFTYLLKSDFERGWKEYNWRWKLKESPAREFSQPLWDGGSLHNRTLLIHAEQGFGDTIQFCRYLPMVIERGGRVIFGCPRELKSLLTISSKGWEVVCSGDDLPPFDVHCPLLSLPMIFGTTLQTIPAHVPYLSADPRQTAAWNDRLSVASCQIGLARVGLVWAGNSDFIYDKLRSPRDICLFAPLARMKNVRFFSLQKGSAAAQTQNPPAGMRLIDWTGDLHDFADTAALIANLDLVISSDTAVAHLAGAMGKPVWVILPAAPDWRWMLHREDCPWYPSMKLFRQHHAGDWSEVMQRITAALETLI